MDTDTETGIEYVHCHVCGADDYRVLHQISVRPDQLNKYARNVWDIVQCNHCDLIYTNPQPDAEALSIHYRFENEYDRQFIQDWFLDNAQLQGPTWQRYLSVIQSYAPGGTLLDVGCGAGTFLAKAQRAGFNVTGQEVSPYFVEHCRTRHAFPVLQGELHALSLAPHSFDVATAFDVIEHHPNPRQMLQTMHKMVRPGGVVAISTHDIGNPLARFYGAEWRYINPIGHLTYFSRSTLFALLRECGFEPLKSGGIHTVDTSRMREIRNWVTQFTRAIVLRSLILGLYRPLTRRFPRLTRWELRIRNAQIDHRKLMIRAGTQIIMNDDILVVARAT